MMGTNAAVQVARKPNPWLIIVAGCVSIVAVWFMFAAADTMVTEHVPGSFIEHWIFTGGEFWFFLLILFFLRYRYRFLGVMSILMLYVNYWGTRAIGPTTYAGFHPAYVAMAGGLVWFLILGGGMIAFGIKQLRSRSAPSGE